jgi:hypothetical protein|nr:MAG TPA: hypothetical protein [Caudoviricetes sp.]
MNLKEKFIEKRDATIEWASEHKAEIIAGTVATVTGLLVVKHVMDNNKAIKGLEVIPEMLIMNHLLLKNVTLI